MATTTDPRDAFFDFAEANGIMGVKVQDGTGWATERRVLVQRASAGDAGTATLDRDAFGVFLASADPTRFRVSARHYEPYTGTPPPREGHLINYHGRLYRITLVRPRNAQVGTYALDLFAYRYIDQPVGGAGQDVPGLLD